MYDASTLSLYTFRNVTLKVRGENICLININLVKSSVFWLRIIDGENILCSYYLQAVFGVFIITKWNQIPILHREKHVNNCMLIPFDFR